jgi:RNA polymerase sigma factor (sigma-70 family)
VADKQLETKFEDDIKQHELLIHKVTRIYASSYEDQQDLFQDIVIQLWNGYPKFKGDSKISTWMYRVALNTAISSFRKKKDYIDSYDPDELPHNRFDSADYKDKEAQYIQLHRAIARLNEIEKGIILLFLEEKSYDEMEEILGISQGNLRVKMNRIKEKLRQLTK